MNISALGDFLKDTSPFSTMRLSMILILVLFVPGFVWVWISISMKTGILATIPDSVCWLLGILLGAKIAQKVVEIVPKTIAVIKGVVTSEGNSTELTTKDNDNKSV
jgi:hypothetical protein